MTTLGRRLIQSAREAVAIAKGEAAPETYRVHAPTDIDVAAIRKDLAPTQVASTALNTAAPVRTPRHGRT